MHLCTFCYAKSINRGRKIVYPCKEDGCNGRAIKVSRHTRSVAEQLLRMGYHLQSATVSIQPTVSFVYAESVIVNFTFTKPYSLLCFPELPLAYRYSRRVGENTCNLTCYYEHLTTYTRRYDVAKEMCGYLENWCTEMTQRALPTLLALAEFYL